MSQADNLAALATNVNSSGVLQPASGGTGVTSATGTGSVVLSNSPTLVTPTLGSASATQLTTGLGSAAAPALTFTGDTNTGIFSPTADTIAFTEGGVESMRIDSSGNVGIGATPTNRFHVADNSASAMIYGLQSGAGDIIALSSGASEKFRITNAGNVGIGTSSPSHRLDVQAAQGTMGVTSTTGTNISYVFAANTGGSFLLGKDSSTGALTGTAYSNFLYNGSAYPMVFFTNGSERARISSAGGFSVGTTSDPGAGAIYATGNITAFFSDERLKTKTGDIENALDKVCQIETLLYHANETAVELGYDASIQEVGVTAQSVQKVQPEVVVPAPVDDKYLTVRYEKLVPLLIEAIKELKAEVDALKGK